METVTFRMHRYDQKNGEHKIFTLNECLVSTGDVATRSTNPHIYEFIAQFENGESTFRTFNLILTIFHRTAFLPSLRMKSVDVISNAFVSKISQSIHIPSHSNSQAMQHFYYTNAPLVELNGIADDFVGSSVSHSHSVVDSLSPLSLALALSQKE